jgi:predicted ATP-dependent serine protease
MVTIICKNCGNEAQKRKGSEFCSTSCRTQFWNSKNAKKTEIEQNNHENDVCAVEKTDNAPLENDSKTDVDSEIVPQRFIYLDKLKPNPTYVTKRMELAEYTAQKEKLMLELKRKKQFLTETLKGSKKEATLLGAAIGGGVGKGLLGAALGGLAGNLLGKVLDTKSKADIPNIVEEIKKCERKIENIENVINTAQSELIQIPKTIKERVKSESFAYMLYIEQKKKQQSEEFKKSQQEAIRKKQEAEAELQRQKEAENERLRKIEALEKTIVPIQPQSDIAETNEAKPQNRILKATEFAKMSFDALNFGGGWLEFLGQPSSNCYMVIHGRPGSGKTTFTLKLADYFAVKFGKTLYISGEEGFSKTLKDKISLLNIENDNLDVTDLHSLDEVVTYVPENEYSFIILDSLNNMRIDAAGLQQIRKKYPNSALICIAQSTKQGLMRGSNEIIHDCDIEIVVDKGIAKTIKNRYLENDMEFQIF